MKKKNTYVSTSVFLIDSIKMNYVIRLTMFNTETDNNLLTWEFLEKRFNQLLASTEEALFFVCAWARFHQKY